MKNALIHVQNIIGGGNESSNRESEERVRHDKPSGGARINPSLGLGTDGLPRPDDPGGFRKAKPPNYRGQRMYLYGTGRLFDRQRIR